jgi:hypothetical protein
MRSMSKVDRGNGGIVVLVTGGRDYDDQDAERAVFAYLDCLACEEPIATILTGACSATPENRKRGLMQGADWMAIRWAVSREVSFVGMPAEWSRFGRPAGPRRNREMIKFGKPDLVVAFPGGDGTKDAVTFARERGIRVIEVGS